MRASLKFVLGITAAAAISLSQYGYAEEKSAEELAKESEAACTASATTKPTPQGIIDKVNEAAALIEKEGKAALVKFQGKDSKFIFAGTYIWVHSFEGTMMMHPIKYKMNGQSLLGFQDSNGKKFFVEMIDTCKANGAGWVDYMWPKPGVKEASLKVSYVKKAMCDGKEVCVGCGVYDMTLDDVKKAAAK